MSEIKTKEIKLQIGCGDERIKLPLKTIFTKNNGNGQPLLLPGGPAFLLGQDEKIFANYFSKVIEVLNVKEMIYVIHNDCRMYNDEYGKNGAIKQREDLRKFLRVFEKKIEVIKFFEIDTHTKIGKEIYL
jgi:hypothetical protein